MNNPLILTLLLPLAAAPQTTLRNAALAITATSDGSYEIRTTTSQNAIVGGQVAAKVDKQWLHAKEYARHNAAESPFEDELGRGRRITVTHSGFAGHPDLVSVIRLYDRLPQGDIEVSVRNTTPRSATVEAIRLLDVQRNPAVDLGGPEEATRVLSDSFSENRPIIKIYDFSAAPRGGHWAANSQLLYNRSSKTGLFFGALTSRKFLTILRLSAGAYTIDSTGTTEVHERGFLAKAPAEDRVELSLPIAPGEALSSERVLFSAGPDYHAQLEAYGAAVRVVQKARVPEKNLLGWWSWTALYSGLTSGLAATNAEWMSARLRSLGYEFFHLDEGYQYARGEYITTDAARFPEGMRPLARQVANLGLKLGIWTAPFEVSTRAWVYEHHKDWLVHNAKGQPIRVANDVTGADPMYALDTTHPGAQAYLRQTYRTLSRDWGVRYIKMDFMDEASIEGYYHRPHTTAMEAQQIGLAIIRESVGEEVHLDKDGSPMLNAVGLVDEGRISIDTAHEYARIKRGGPGIAARYYMNRNFFLNDPDAFNVSSQLIGETSSYTAPLTLSEAQVSIALVAVSGGMYEIGDDLPSLGAEPERLALVTNPELLRIAKLSRAARPLDLMTYANEDEQPSVFLLRVNRRQSIYTVFNWTDAPRLRKIPGTARQRGYDILDRGKPFQLGTDITLPPHSVRMIKLVDESIPAAPPIVSVQAPTSGKVAEEIRIAALPAAAGNPVISYAWKFGDGAAAEGSHVTHAYTRAGTYTVELNVEAADGLTARKIHTLRVTGEIRTPFPVSESRRYTDETKP